MKHILITGASPGGIGYHCALRLKEQGYRVVGTVRTAEDAETLVSRGIPTVHMEMSDYASINSGFNDAMVLLDNRIDVVFQNAGFGQAGFVEDLPVEAFEEQFKVNVFGLHQLNTLVIPYMRQQGEGRIVIHSSVLGFVGMACRGAYVASKYALEGMVQSMRVEMKGSGIEFSLLNTGPVESRFRANALKALLKHVNVERSVNKDIYNETVLPRLNKPDHESTGNYPQEYVFKALDHAINARKPKANYYITPPTKALFWLEKLLPKHQLDRLLRIVDR
ncbi:MULTISPECIES: SDR family NAD(P)-dependent oxidoreductase [unclassified Marinobacterium]|uniref:SDR family NAD(P)-dependent oxidoreductase n=1 Tax=unclassified Marinobacterium TaxID=2644139 RepID=UPI00156955F9|nr:MULTISPECIES: SDR family NAD(P)-dependent oxidoreductase [unclassified Marinobacterium]NRP14378.1 2-dehydro-3-deoxy-D-gluconate 5-dehydrogenase [Marinobacterium sp. xm-a-152]NRP38924.1 2-dehydro-3-deoxy-D-gluconate 5-dehydrogenase [Marinobacterium sp. xm-a-121]NRP99740.1 2-dehydro-3-deoxy-D-gluconate 5-dehydrogenase [Marinobacterium sp. xm-v-233]